jgi:glycosyltransferase involved in cell wall biosynthesis
MRIGILTEYFPTMDGRGVTGGVEKRAWEVATRLAGRHDVVVVASRQFGHLKREGSGNLTILRVGSIHPYSNRGHVLSRLRFCFSLLRSRNLLQGCDVVDSQNFTTYVPGFFCARAVGAHPVATWHEVWLGSWVRHKGTVTGLAGEIWERIAITRPWDAVVCVTEYIARQVRSYSRGKIPVYVVPNGVDMKKITQISCSSKVPGLVVYVGRLVSSKGVDILIRAFALVIKKHSVLRDKLVLEIIGDGPARADLQALVEKLSLSECVRFRGRLESHEEVLRRIKEAELLVNPSALEGFGIVVGEAAACGTPVIISDIPAFREVQAYVKGGRFFPVGDVESLADAIYNHFMVSRIEVGDASVLDWDRVVVSLEKVYQSVVGPRHDGSSTCKSLRTG